MLKFKILVFLVLGISSLFGQGLKFVRIDPGADQITLKNFSNATIDITNYRLCASFTYTTNLTAVTLESGSLSLAAGDSVTLSGFALNDAGSDLGLFLAGVSGFGDATNMVDFAQWGSSGNGREGVADSKGIWTTGEFVENIETLHYTGDGTQHGKNTWGVAVQPVASLAHKSAHSRFVLNIPGQGMLYTSNMPDVSEVTLYTPTGELVKQLKIESGFGVWTAQNIQKGVYLIVLNNGHDSESGKIAVK